MEETSNKKYAKAKEYIKVVFFDLLFIVIFFFVVTYRFPYVVYKPGSAINLSDRIEIANDYKMAGSYSMNSVSVATGNLPTLLMSFVIPNWDIVKESDITYKDLSYEETLNIEKLQLQNSMDQATILAYEKAGLEVTTEIERQIVVFVDEKAKTDIKLLDEIQTIDGKSYESTEEIKAYVQTKSIGDIIKIVVLSDGEEVTRTAEVYEEEGVKYIGISQMNDIKVITNPEFSIKAEASEAGSSGGLMMTLAIYDSLLEEDLTGGKKIMGTGTIEADGSVGAIGGVKYKLLGAENNDCDIFFIPKDNYEEAQKVHKKNKLEFDLVMVETLDDAIAYLHSQNK